MRGELRRRLGSLAAALRGLVRRRRVHELSDAEADAFKRDIHDLDQELRDPFEGGQQRH